MNASHEAKAGGSTGVGDEASRLQMRDLGGNVSRSSCPTIEGSLLSLIDINYPMLKQLDHIMQRNQSSIHESGRWIRWGLSEEHIGLAVGIGRHLAIARRLARGTVAVLALEPPEEEKQGLHCKKTVRKAIPKSLSKSAGKSSPTPFDMKDDEVESDTHTAEVDGTSESKFQSPEVATARDRTDSIPSPLSIDEIDTEAIMAAFRQATRGRGSLEREELLKDVSVIRGYRRLGPKIQEALRGLLRAAIRRRIIEAEGANLVRAGTTTMADYDLEELRETFRSVMRKGTNYEREDVIHVLARHLGFARVIDTSRDAIKSAINSAIRQGILAYEGTTIWRID